MIISGCNSVKKLVEWLRKSVRVSECHKKKQEAYFDLWCLWVPGTDKSCNQFNEVLLAKTS
jgi:hypothetical protein